MNVRYYYDHDSADIAVQGQRAIELIMAGLDTFRDSTVFTQEIARIERRSIQEDTGTTYEEVIFDDADERSLVVTGLRTVVRCYERQPGWRNRRQARYARKLLRDIVAAEDLPQH